MPVRKAADRYVADRIAAGQSARGLPGGFRRRLAKFARQICRPDLAAVFEHADGERFREAKAVAEAIEVLRHAGPSTPQISDDIGLWLPARAVSVLRAHDIATLADLTVRIPRRRQWWKAVAGLGPASARRIEAFFAAHPALSGVIVRIVRNLAVVTCRAACSKARRLHGFRGIARIHKSLIDNDF